MYKEHPVFTKPANPNQKIWRYMEFSKFVSLISTSRLYFGAASSMVDAFEGSYSHANVLLRKEWYGDLPAEFQQQISAFTRESRNHTYINCWHMAAHESAAMWGLYQAEGRGVAIRSTFNHLKDSLKGTANIYIGTVHYIDYKNDPMPEGNTFYPYVHKRRSFEHEQEIRAVTSDPNYPSAPDSPHIDFDNNIPVDLDLLIDAIQVAPGSPDWYFKAVQSVSEKYGIKTTVKRSAMDKDPVF